MIEFAYDLKTLEKPVDRSAADNQGWVFGLPPGIASHQWPLDPYTGYPLMHGFTLLLPEDYRAHGPDIVALSFFSIASDHNDGGPSIDEAMVAAVTGDSPPDDPRYRPFWRAPEQQHPRLYRMQDILGCPYALILLTRAEFDGPLCVPPVIPRNELAMDSRTKKISGTYSIDSEPRVEDIEWKYAPCCPRPAWLDMGAARAHFAAGGGEAFGVHRRSGRAPESDLADNRALRWTPRANDPNTGKKPRDYWSSNAATSDYTPYFYFEGEKADSYREHEWAKGHGADHIGGTMRPTQTVPDMSPYYVEFEESFGGYNFGGGNAQLDFRDMKFDWACG
jgi:hypothetical protein